MSKNEDMLLSLPHYDIEFMQVMGMSAQPISKERKAAPVIIPEKRKPVTEVDTVNLNVDFFFCNKRK